MSYYYALSSSLNLNLRSHFISLLQLLFFDKTLYSFFNNICLNGKKGLILKLVILVLNNLKNKTLISPILILKSVILNNKLFFRVNETKFRKKTFYYINYLSPKDQVKYSVSRLSKYLRQLIDNKKGSLVDTITKFFLSFFLKDDFIYKNYISQIAESNYNINYIFSRLESSKKRNKSKNERLFNSYNNLYLNKLFKKYLKKISSKFKSKGSLSLVPVSEVDKGKSIIKVDSDLALGSVSIGKLNRKLTKSKNNINNSIKTKSKKKRFSNNYKVIKKSLNTSNNIYNTILTSRKRRLDTPFEYLDLSNIKLNPFFKNYTSLKSKLIYYFMSDQLKFSYVLIESVYNYVFNFMISSILDDLIISLGRIKKDYLDDNIFNSFKTKLGLEIDKFLVWLIHVELKSKIDLDHFSIKENRIHSIYKWMLYDRSLTSYLYRYYIKFYSILRKFMLNDDINIDTIPTIDICSFIKRVSDIDNQSISLYKVRKRIFNTLNDHIYGPGGVRYKKWVRFLKKREMKRLMYYVNSVLKANLFINIARVIFKLLPYVIKRLNLNSVNINYRKPRNKFISYKFKRMRVIGFH